MTLKIELTSRNSWLKDSGYTVEQEEAIYDATLEDLGDNPRWYLDNLEYLKEYRVSWHCYGRDKTAPVLPRRFIVKTKGL